MFSEDDDVSVQSVNQPVPMAGIIKIETKQSEGEMPQENTLNFSEFSSKELKVEKNASLLTNTSQRLSYVVRSPSIRVVRFEEDFIVPKANENDEQLTPTLKSKSSASSKKLQTRQPTPMMQSTTKKSSETLNHQRKNYFKRFSKTAVKQESGQVQNLKASYLTNKNDKNKKQANTLTSKNNFTKVRRTLGVKSFWLRNSKKPSLSRSKSATSALLTSTSVSQVDNIPYQGLAVLNNKFMNSVRNYSQFVVSTPKLTIPKGPCLLTEKRLGVKKYNTVLSLHNDINKEFVAPVIKPVASNKPVEKTTTALTKRFTKAISPHFSTDARIKVWHLKHDTQSQVDGCSQTTQKSNNKSAPIFKARPAPNFKKLQANEEKRKKEALLKAKQAIHTSKVVPFSFESRAHSVKNEPRHH